MQAPATTHHPLACQALRETADRSAWQKRTPCGAVIGHAPYPAIPTRRTLHDVCQVGWDQGFFGNKCTWCGVVSEFRWDIPEGANPARLANAVPYFPEVHVLLADRWRWGRMAEDALSIPLFTLWNMRYGIPEAADLELHFWIEVHPSEPQAWPNGKTDADMPGAPVNLKEGHLG